MSMSISMSNYVVGRIEKIQTLRCGERRRFKYVLLEPVVSISGVIATHRRGAGDGKAHLSGGKLRILSEFILLQEHSIKTEGYDIMAVLRFLMMRRLGRRVS